MKDILIDQARASIGELIGKGGEGEVYAIKGHPGHAVKIYKNTLRDTRRDKVCAMVQQGLADKTTLIAYPGQLVTDQQGNFLGFVMRLVSGYRPLHELYSPKSRQRHFPKADYRFLIRTALNVVRAVGKVHQTGCVIGDLNHSGVLVAQDATVALIDADSFQFRLNGTTYPCLVGVPDFTPPELHGKNLSSVTRTIEHDNFGLAVAIFHLLFMGRHPYAGRHKGPDISLSEAIAQNRFAYSRIRQSYIQTTPPPGAMTLDIFPDTVAKAFENAFGLFPDARPNAQDWAQTLTILEGSLNHCTKVQTHYFPAKASGCTWCKMASGSGFDMFPSFATVQPSVHTDVRGTEQAIQEVLAFRFPVPSDLLHTPVNSHAQTSAIQNRKEQLFGQVGFGLVLLGAAFFGFIAYPGAFIIWAIAGFWGWSLISNREIPVGPYLQAYKEADARVQRELDAFLRRNGLSEVVKVYGDLQSVITTYKRHDTVLANELSAFKANREKRQRDAYLDNFSIRSANISGIGPAKTAALMSYGIETAADVNRHAVFNVPGFGEVMTKKVMDWRHKLETRFRYNPNPTPQDTADENALRARLAVDKVKLESTIRNGLGELRNARTRFEVLPARARADRTLTEALVARAKTEMALRELGATVPVSTVTMSVNTQTQSTPPPVTSSQTVTPQTTTGAPTCPLCHSSMRRRYGKRGAFWGCTRYPRCRGTRNI